MDDLIPLCAIFAVVAISSFVIVKQQAQFEQQRKEWSQERKDLLDRIQAPSFHDYTNKVVREMKAKKDDEEKQEPIQFVT